MIEITDLQLIAAVSKAVEVGLLPRSACGENYLANYEKVRAVLEAGLNAPRSKQDLLVETATRWRREVKAFKAGLRAALAGKPTQ